MKTGMQRLPNNVQSSIYECIVDDIDDEKVTLKTEIANLDIIPSHIDLVGAEVEMVNIEDRENKMAI